MFTLEQIKQAHSKIKSGADFPSYVQEIIGLGVTSYTIFVSDGHAQYYGVDGYIITSPAKYDTLNIATQMDKDHFIQELKVHQQGGSDYMTFCTMAATSGIGKRIMDMQAMTCSYYDTVDNAILVEQIPTI